MNKIFATSPESINLYQDWLKFFDKIGQPNGLFFANFPKPWLPKFKEHLESLKIEDWDDWDKKKIIEFFIHLKNNNSLLALHHQYDYSKTWELNFLNLSDEVKAKSIAIGKRNNEYEIKDFSKLSPLELKVNSFNKGALSPKEFVNLLGVYFTQTKKIAFVDRHNYLINSQGQVTQFTNCIRSILEIKRSSQLGELIIYAVHDETSHPYMKDKNELIKVLSQCFQDYRIPVYGIKYICCKEIPDRRIGNLHTRLICTNHVIFHLGDSIPGRNESQQITRISDPYESSDELTYWIDEEHNLDVVTEATYYGR